MPSGPAPTAEFILAVRTCAANGMSMEETAQLLSTKNRKLTRSTIASVANRAKPFIKFNSKRKATGPRTSRVKYKPVVQQHLTDVRKALDAKPVATGPKSHYVAPRRTPLQSPAGPQCSWAGCTRSADEGDMFCYGHARRGLM